jgi:hypothetical protein
MQYRILCRIVCSGRDTDTLDHHFAEFYEDVPFKSWDSGVTSRHLSGHFPVPDLKRYISATKDRASFLVFREYHCKNSRQHAPRHRKTVFPKLKMMNKDKGEHGESILIISRHLEKAIRNIAVCDPEDHFVPPHRRLGSLILTPPYRFVYHHRSLLLTYAQTCRSSIKSQILALLDYVEGTYGVQYRQADDLFRHGKTNRPSLEFLFCPGDILLSSTQGTNTAYTMHSWPVTASGTALDCWGWTFDGLQFRRKGITLMVEGEQKYIDGVIPIQQLPIYPLKYAPQDLRSHLKSRGQRFWNLRFQHFVSYTGWDVKKDENHVRYSLILHLGR